MVVNLRRYYPRRQRIHLATLLIHTCIPDFEGVAKGVSPLYRVARVFRNIRLVGVSRTKRIRVC